MLEIKVGEAAKLGFSMEINLNSVKWQSCYFDKGLLPRVWSNEQ